MNYKRTILNVSATLLLVILIIYTIADYSALSAGEGWGLLITFVFSAISVFLLLLDFLLQQIIRNRNTLMITEVVILSIALFIMAAGLG